MPGKDGFVLTGQLGDVMKESARIALSYVRGHEDELGIAPDAFEDREFHVHVPAGAIPKDGPSAGITMTTALASLLSGRPVKHNVGMTGEVTLQGRVLPIGGLKQKVLAAHAAGLTEVILPERNRGDLEDVPEDVREQMKFHPVMTIGEVLGLALEPAPADVAHLRPRSRALRQARRPRPEPSRCAEDRGRHLILGVGREQVAAAGHQLELRVRDQGSRARGRGRTARGCPRARARPASECPSARAAARACRARRSRPSARTA